MCCTKGYIAYQQCSILWLCLHRFPLHVDDPRAGGAPSSTLALTIPVVDMEFAKVPIQTRGLFTRRENAGGAGLRINCSKTASQTTPRGVFRPSEYCVLTLSTGSFSSRLRDRRDFSCTLPFPKGTRNGNYASLCVLLNTAVIYLMPVGVRAALYGDVEGGLIV